MREQNTNNQDPKNNDLRIKGCLLHKSDLWNTPKLIYNYYIKQRKCFDPCPSNPTFDGLKIKWKKQNFVNPPYSKIAKWIDKALEEVKKGHNSVLLIPARTDTKWFKKLLENNVIIRFIEGRLHFNDEGPAPFPSMLVVISTINNKTVFKYLKKEDFNCYFNS